MCFTAFPNSFYGPGAWPHLWKNAMFRLQFVCNFSGMLQDSLGENTGRVSSSFSINIWKKKITFLTATEPNFPRAHLLPEITSHWHRFFPHFSLIPVWGSGDGTADPRDKRTSSPRGTSQRDEGLGPADGGTQGVSILDLISCLHKPLLLFFTQPTCTPLQPRQLQADPTTIHEEKCIISIKTTALSGLVSTLVTPTAASCSPQRAPTELDALPPPKRTLLFEIRIQRGLFVQTGLEREHGQQE